MTKSKKKNRSATKAKAHKVLKRPPPLLNDRETINEIELNRRRNIYIKTINPKNITVEYVDDRPVQSEALFSEPKILSRAIHFLAAKYDSNLVSKCYNTLFQQIVKAMKTGDFNCYGEYEGDGEFTDEEMGATLAQLAHEGFATCWHAPNDSKERSWEIGW